MDFYIKMKFTQHMEPLHNTQQSANSAGVSLESENPSSLVEKNKRLAQRGRTWLCMGVALMGLSFATNYFLFHSGQSFEMAMYIMTTLGAVCIVKSLADLLGF
ncbi:MAG TPA: hypothetical protein PKL15_18495 [Saprospiraceae bacterium]|nr:hypothetical protein [Saprospiraceae bacterium]